MTTNPQTKPVLLGINHDGPVRVIELGKGGQGIIWTVQPENFDRVVEMINKSGGPSFWRIEAL